MLPREVSPPLEVDRVGVRKGMTKYTTKGYLGNRIQPPKGAGKGGKGAKGGESENSTVYELPVSAYYCVLIWIFVL